MSVALRGGLKENYYFPLSNAVGLHAEKGNGQWSAAK